MSTHPVENATFGEFPARGRAERLLIAAQETDGFLDLDEGRALSRAARAASASGLGCLVEVGSYKGRSALFIAAGIAAHAILREGQPPVLFSIDHHRGSEEMQPAWEHHDPSIVDASARMDSLPSFRTAIEGAGALDLVIGVVGDSPTVARAFDATIALCFLDGGHGDAIAWADYRSWAPKVAVGGRLVIHDVFEDPAMGGRPPYECYCDALASGAFVLDEEASCRSLRVLIRSRPDRRPDLGDR